ncbi:hypothetical protein AAC387_Pa12g2277 [Persea americana]
MASSSGSKEGPSRTGSRRVSRQPTMEAKEKEILEPIDIAQMVPSSLAPIVPILRVANDLEPSNPRIAYLCRFHAFEKAHLLDPLASGRGVRQFKTFLMHRLERDESETHPILTTSDSREIIKFYELFYRERIKEGAIQRKPEDMAKNYQIASVLYDVLETVVPPEKIDAEVKRQAREVKREKEHFVHYNVLPIYGLHGLGVGVTPTIMTLPEIKAAVSALCMVNNLRMPRIRSTASGEHNVDDGDKPIHDLLDWLSLEFGFQKGNVANQREHLILLLANIGIRNRHPESYTELQEDAVQVLMNKIFKNYNSWCAYLHCSPNIKPLADIDIRQVNLLYIGLYLLIWGEASNIRFMPECICYIFHHMAGHLYNALCGKDTQLVTGENNLPIHEGDESFLREVVTPIYQVIQKEAQRNKGGTVKHSKWRNYDDLNEYFWSKDCFKLGWPMNRNADFFVHTEEERPRNKSVLCGRRKPKTNFVEVRTFWHLFRSFDRMWVFFILAFQAMIIVAWSPSGTLAAFFDEHAFKNVLSILITAALLNFLQATLDIVLSWKAWGSMQYTQIVRYILKFVVAAVWVIVMHVGYSRSVQNPTGLVRFSSSWATSWQSQPFYSFAIVIYLMPNLVAALLFMVPPLRRTVERSNWHVVLLLLWWAQPKLYVGRGMHEDFFSLMKYTLFWVVLLLCKLAFSYYVEILPLIEPTKLIMGMEVSTSREWHEFFPNLKNNIGGVVSIWAPIVLVYFMDTQLWYAIFSTIFGGIIGAFSRLGEIRTLAMLRSRFDSVPTAFCKHLVPSKDTDKKGQSRKKRIHMADTADEHAKNAKFSPVWNEFIDSLRIEDYISNTEKDLLRAPYSWNAISVMRWPSFLLASKIPIALDMAKDLRGKEDADLFRKIKSDDYMHAAVIECYETLKEILLNLLIDEGDTKVINQIHDEVIASITEKRFLTSFRMSNLPQLSSKLEKLLVLLKNDENREEQHKKNIVYILQDIMEIIKEDVMTDRNRIHLQEVERTDDKTDPMFGNINLNLMEDGFWMEKVVRLHLLLTVKESAINIPTNLEARRRITFFINSLFMNMPDAPKVRDMLSFSVLTPYYREEVLYSMDELNKLNEDGISVLFYLQKIYTDEWANFCERTGLSDETDIDQHTDEVCHWVSYRGQTLSRTVRGMMYYRQALEVQCFLEAAEGTTIYCPYRNGEQEIHYQDEHQNEFWAHSQAVADMKFTYVVSCQIYGKQKKSFDSQDQSSYKNILNLMLRYPSLRVAYIDEREELMNGKSEIIYYSVLVKGHDQLDEEIYRIKLPGPPAAIGEGKHENQNHAIIFTRGEALQTIDMNQDNYLEEAFKMRNVLQEFLKPRHTRQRPTILGLREHIFTGSVSSLGWSVSSQETSFVTIGQRIRANPLKVRFHYGHPDVFDKIFHMTRGGISKASKVINLSGDIFSGFNSTLRGGTITHHEYMQVGKGCDIGMNQISLFEAKVANGNGEQTLSRDVYRLGRRFDFYRMLSFYFTTVGFYFSSMVTVLTVYVFLYGRLYLVMSGLERAMLEDPSIQQTKSLETALASQSVFQLGLSIVLPMVMEIGLERGFRTALVDFIVMQLQLASVFFTFQLGTRVHYYGRRILHGGAKYRATGPGFVVYHAKFAENYRMYSRSHFIKGLELMVLLVVYEVYGHSYRRSSMALFVTFSMWFLVASWFFAPFVFNPSGFEWQKTVDDWTDWKRWLGNRGGIGIAADLSWESWWDGELEHLKHTDIRGRVLEIILALRFLMYQYGIVYHLNITHHTKSMLVYGLSWLVIVTVIVVLKMVSIFGRRLGSNFPLMFRVSIWILFLGFVSTMIVLFVFCGLTISDVLASIIGLLSAGWSLLLIGQACRPLLRKVGLSDSIKGLARGYDNVMGLIIFIPIVILSCFPFVSEFQKRLLFNQAFSRSSDPSDL